MSDIRRARALGGGIACARRGGAANKRRVAIRRPMKATAAPEKGGPRVNRDIRAVQVQLIDAEGHNRGVVNLADAQTLADEAALDLVEIVPNATPAGLQDPRFRKIPLPRAEEVVRGAQAPEGGRDQGDQAPARHRRPRLRSEDALGAPLLRRGRQGQGDAALPRPRDGASGHRLQAPAAGRGPRRRRSPRSRPSR